MAEELLTMEQVEAVMDFAEGMYFAERFGYYDPLSQNLLLKGLGGNKSSPTLQQVKDALCEVRKDPATVVSYQEFMKHYDMLFEKVVKQYTSVLAYDLVPVCKNAYTQMDYESIEYYEDKIRLQEFLDRFDYKTEFQKVTENVFLREVYYTWFRREKYRNKGMKYTLQVLPQDYCLMTGYWEKGFLFDFDMMYFTNSQVDIDSYDPAFKKYWNKVYNSDGQYRYKPAVSSLKKRNGHHGDYVQTSPEDGAWMWKFQAETFDLTPYLAPLLKFAVRNDTLQDLQQSKDIATAYGIVTGSIGTYDAAKSGTKPNQFKIDARTLGAFMQKAKQGLGDSIFKLAALPVENIKMIQYNDSNAKMETDALDNFGAVGGYLNSPIYATERMSASEVEAACCAIYNIMKPLYAQYANFLEFWADKITAKYKWKFSFEGSTYSFLREREINNIFRLADKGMVLPPAAWAAKYNYQPFDFERMLQESKWTGWAELWQMPLNVNTSTDGGGRPQVDTVDGNTGDSTESARDSKGLMSEDSAGKRKKTRMALEEQEE